MYCRLASPGSSILLAASAVGACTASVNSAPPGSPVPVTATNPNSGTDRERAEGPQPAGTRNPVHGACRAGQAMTRLWRRGEEPAQCVQANDLELNAPQISRRISESISGRRDHPGGV